MARRARPEDMARLARMTIGIFVLFGCTDGRGRIVDDGDRDVGPGPVPDAAVGADGGAAIDAGMSADAGVGRDAGSDAGTPGEPDAGEADGGEPDPGSAPRRGDCLAPFDLLASATLDPGDGELHVVETFAGAAPHTTAPCAPGAGSADVVYEVVAPSDGHLLVTPAGPPDGFGFPPRPTWAVYFATSCGA